MCLFLSKQKLDIQMKNLEQLHILQNLMEDSILNQDEFTEQKRIVLQKLNKLSIFLQLSKYIYYSYSISKYGVV